MFRLRAWSDLALMALTFVTTVGLGIEVGTLLAVSLSLLLVIKETTSLRVSLMGRVRIPDSSALGGWTYKYRAVGDRRKRDASPSREAAADRDDENVEQIPGIIVLRIEEDLFFGNSKQLADKLRRVETFGTLDAHPGSEPSSDSGLKAVVLDMEGTFSCDASTARTFYEVIEMQIRRRVAVCLVHLRPEVRELFLRSGVWDLLGESGGGVYERVRDAVEAMEDRISQQALLAEEVDVPEQAAEPSIQPTATGDDWVGRIFGGQRRNKVANLSVDDDE